MVTQHLHGQTVSKGSGSVRLPADEKNIVLAIHVGLLVLAAVYWYTVANIDAPFEKAVGKFDYVVVSEKQWKRFADWGHGTYESLFELPLLREWKSRPGESRGPEIRIYSME